MKGNRRKSLRLLPVAHMQAPKKGSVELLSKCHRRDNSTWVVLITAGKKKIVHKEKVLSMDF